MKVGNKSYNHSEVRTASTAHVNIIGITGTLDILVLLTAGEDRELGDVLAAIRHGRTLETLGPLRRPGPEAHLKSAEELAALGTSLPPAPGSSWTFASPRMPAAEVACRVTAAS